MKISIYGCKQITFESFMSHIAHLVTVYQNQSHSSYWIFTRMSQTKDVFGDGTSSMSLAGRKPKEPTWRSDIISDTAIWLLLCQLLFICISYSYKIERSKRRAYHGLAPAKGGDISLNVTGRNGAERYCHVVYVCLHKHSLDWRQIITCRVNQLTI